MGQERPHIRPYRHRSAYSDQGKLVVTLAGFALRCAVASAAFIVNEHIRPSAKAVRARRLIDDNYLILPLHTKMSLDDVDRVCSVLQEGW